MKKLLPLFLLLSSAAHAQTVESLMFPEANQLPITTNGMCYAASSDLNYRCTMPTSATVMLSATSTDFAQTAIPILNPSFETNAVMTAPDTGGGPWSSGVPQWTTASPSGLWQPTPNVFAQIPDSKTIVWTNASISQDLGIPAQPNTTYTLTVFVGHLSYYEGSYNFSMSAGATSLCNLSGSNKTIPLNTFGQITMPCVIGATAPVGNLVLKLASADGSHQLFDNVLLVSAPNTPPPPPPAFQTMFILGGVRYCTICDGKDDSITGLNLLAGLKVVIVQTDASGNSIGSVSFIMDSGANISGSDAFTINASFPLHFSVGVYMPNGTPVPSLAQRIDVDPIHLQGQGAFHVIVRLDAGKPVVVRGLDWFTGA